ncbi:MAG: O-antigen ligase family protein [Candidatus Omnitrophica bacterium]|nr:O-antigen ligase family protein [Candidatus Omnitrophota bacterium]
MVLFSDLRILAIVFGGCLLVLSFFRPWRGLLIFSAALFYEAAIDMKLFVIESSHLYRSWDALGSFKLFGMAIVIGWFLQALIKKRVKLPPPSRIWLLIGIFMIIVISGMFSIYKANTLVYIYSFLGVVGIYFMICDLCFEHKRIEQLLLVVAIAALINALIAIVQYIFKIDVPWDLGYKFGQYRVVGGMSDPNYFGYQILTVFPIIFFFFYRTRSKLKKIVLFAIEMIMVTSIVLTFSRAAFITLCVVLFFLMIIFIKHKKLSYVIVIILMTSLLGVVIFANPKYSERLSTLFGVAEIGQYGETSERTLKTREDIFFTGTKMFLDHFWLGVGPNNFPIYLESYAHRSLLISRGRGAHNSFLGVSAELGIFGLCLFLLWILFILKGLRFTRKRVPNDPSSALLSEVLQISIFANLFMLTTLGTSFNVKLLWIWFGLAEAMRQVSISGRT